MMSHRSPVCGHNCDHATEKTQVKRISTVIKSYNFLNIRGAQKSVHVQTKKVLQFENLQVLSLQNKNAEQSSPLAKYTHPTE